MESDSDSAARQRFHAFKMGGGAPPNSLHAFSAHSHRRSRSRNSSMSSFSSLSLSASAPALSPPPDSPNSSLAPPSKRPSSHHHRRSSVSTRHESAELMGVSLPDLPLAHSDDNINLGDKDSIRRRALRALEGKPDIAFSKVEIPDIPPDITRLGEFPTKPSFPPGPGINGVNPFAAKRDSFGKMFGSASASKDQLGTLVEEEEEEEDVDARRHTDPLKERKDSPQETTALQTKTRHRPASLNLRPLSLVQGTVVSPLSGNLPTPSATPGTHPNSRKPPITAASNDVVPPIASVPPSNASISVRQAPSRRFSYSLHDAVSASCDLGPKRRSSISYKRSESIPRDFFPPPTSDISPTDRRFSFASDQETLIEQPLSVADQHFLFRSHHVLLSRITELERTLRHRSSPRHHSHTSDVSTAFSEPSNEMLHLISDLKAERDELKRDVDGWRQRVADADKQASILASRIESERREAWVARSRLGLLEVEKSALEKSLEAKISALSQSLAENTILMRERDELNDEIMKLNARLKDADAAADECARLRNTLEQERTRRKELEKTLDDAGLLNTPTLPHPVNGSWRRPLFSAKPISTRPRGLGFQSVDSESSTTDVESLDDSFTKAEFTLDAVTEEEAEYSDEENGLAGYEDEEDSDLSFSSPDGSCIGLTDEPDIKSGPPAGEVLDHTVCPPLPVRPTHKPRSSLSKTWTFPRGKTTVIVKQDDDIDRFFGCLDDADRSPPLTEEMNQNIFSSAFRSMSDDDELPPFVLPSDVGVIVDSSSSRNLGPVPEEDGEDVADDENDEPIGEEVEGGIRFTFNAPPVICVTSSPDVCKTPPPEIRITPPETNPMPAVLPRNSASSKPAPISEPIDDDEDESSLTFVFAPKVQARPAESATSPPRSSPPTPSGGSRPKNGSSPSSIPRAVSLRSMSPKSPSIMFTPSKSASGRCSTPLVYSTPTSKKMSSSIPQLVTPPKPRSTPPKVPRTSVDSPKKSRTGTPNANDPVLALRYLSPSEGGSAMSEVNYSKSSDPSSSGACEYSHAQDTSSLSFIMSNPLAARSPFQKLSHFISFAWAPGATTAASHIVPTSSVSLGLEAMDATMSGIDSSATRRTRQRFVSKASQLEKLRRRFSLEKQDGRAPCCMVSACKGCNAGDVYL